RPFWVMEYVSKRNKRKDYEDNFKKYEQELKVRYYLMFNPEAQEMTLFRHNGKKYVSVKPNRHGRCAVPELDMEVALLDGWVRFRLHLLARRGRRPVGGRGSRPRRGVPRASRRRHRR